MNQAVSLAFFLLVAVVTMDMTYGALTRTLFWNSLFINKVSVLLVLMPSLTDSEFVQTIPIPDIIGTT